MDAALLHTYRLIWADGTMLLDTASIYYSRRPLGGYTLTDFAKGLSTIIRHENDHDQLDQLSEGEGVLDFTEDTTAVRQLLWQFTHGVALEFMAEELSQFPFWAAKVHTVVSARGQSFKDTVLNVLTFYQDKLSRGGVRALFEANVPYLAAAAVTHHAHLRKSVRFFLALMRSHMPLKRASGSFGRLPQQSAPSKPPRKTTAAGVTTGVLSRLATAVMVHPLLLLSVRMLTSPALSGQHWLSAYISLATTHGLPVLYTGLRISMLCALVPLAPWYTLGIPETVLYRRMSGQGQHDSLGGSYSVLYDAIADEGSLGLLSFGLLTACQAVPGFLCFATTRTLLWLVCGPTRQRERQYKRRKEVSDVALAMSMLCYY
mmetsp:Transcript_20858/g.38798  ORF Transcript_20858/g.38798 Transcript_20858/m.38798 type:complete len:374 (+) Transcript_20858:157-1278(+)